MKHSKLNKFSGFLLLIGILLSSCVRQTVNQEQVYSMYACDDVILKGIPTSGEYNLEGGVQVFYLHETNWTKTSGVKVREWVKLYDAVAFDSYCKEVLRFKEVSVNSSQE